MGSAIALKSWNVLTATNLFGEVLEERRATLDIVKLEDSLEDLAVWSAAETK